MLGLLRQFRRISPHWVTSVTNFPLDNDLQQKFRRPFYAISFFYFLHSLKMVLIGISKAYLVNFKYYWYVEKGPIDQNLAIRDSSYFHTILLILPAHWKISRAKAYFIVSRYHEFLTRYEKIWCFKIIWSIVLIKMIKMLSNFWNNFLGPKIIVG